MQLTCFCHLWLKNVVCLSLLLESLSNRHFWATDGNCSHFACKNIFSHARIYFVKCGKEGWIEEIILTLAGKLKQLSSMCTWNFLRRLQRDSNPRQHPQSSWVRIAVKTPEILPKLSSKCEDHLFHSSRFSCNKQEVIYILMSLFRGLKRAIWSYNQPADCLWVIEMFSKDYRKTNTKVIIPLHQSQQEQTARWANQIS